SILISVKARLQIFELSDIRYLPSTDTLSLETFADTRQVLFVIIPTADDTFNFVVSMMYTQLFMSLYRYCETRSSYGWQCHIKNGVTVKVVQANSKQERSAAKEEIERFVGEIKKGVITSYDESRHVYNVYTKTTKELVGWRGNEELLNKFIDELKQIKIAPVGRACPNHVRLLGDEFANISAIPNLDKRLATVRKYNISMFVILQAITQLKKMYKDEWNTIAGNCDVKLFLGSSDNETIKWICETGGKKTTRVQNLNFNGKQGEGMAINLSSFDLITPDLLSMMSDEDCLVMVRAERPYYGKKYVIENHKNYSYANARKGMYEIKPSVNVEEYNSNIPFRERTHISQGFEDFEKIKDSRQKKLFNVENNVQKGEGEEGKKSYEEVKKEIDDAREKREEDEDEVLKKMEEDIENMMGEAITQQKDSKCDSKEILNMSDTGIQEIIESRIMIEPYRLDEWEYMMT
nr:TraM recognition domain-containing protein [Lachnospiraceae bacterium]